jgi:hypothetical protein
MSITLPEAYRYCTHNPHQSHWKNSHPVVFVVFGVIDMGFVKKLTGVLVHGAAEEIEAIMGLLDEGVGSHDAYIYEEEAK